MPIDKRKSHSNIVKELLDEYKKSGKIGNTHPRDLSHATSIANAIAYKSKKESKELRLLSAMKKVNAAEDSMQLSLFNHNQNIMHFLSYLSKKNWQEIHSCAETFYAEYMKHARNILKKWNLTPAQFSTHKYLAPMSFDQACMKTEDFSSVEVYMSYTQNISSRLEVAIQSACTKASTSNFFCTYDDTGLFLIKPTEAYRKYIDSQLELLK